MDDAKLRLRVRSIVADVATEADLAAYFDTGEYPDIDAATDRILELIREVS